MSDKKVITRFAPSPTGFMHVGSVRTALFAWLWAKKNNGTFILRIEDTDKEREVEGSIDHIKNSLQWLGLDWDQGPYLQSERLDVYKKYAQILVDKGYAYPDPYTEDEVGEFRNKAELAKKPFLYREHRPKEFSVWDGAKPLRFKVPTVKSFKWNDLVYGDLSAGPEALDDFILIKSNGYPTYNFAHIVDDIEMKVTHVMRGEEFISSTPKFLSVYEALDIAPPFYATLPVILGPDGKKKLSKRDGVKDLLQYKDEGYLPDAFINFLALLGWNPGDDREIFSRADLIKAFNISRIQKSDAQMNARKLDWMNKEHLKLLPPEEIKNKIFECLPENMRNPKLVPIILERISKWGDVKEMVEAGELDFFIQAPKFSKEKLLYKDFLPEAIAKNLQLAIESLEQIDVNNFTEEEVKRNLMQITNTLSSRGELLHPVRFALSGKNKSPDPFIIASILGKNETLSRLQKAI
ncbi:glutamate--tRNA ligase [Candidatus Nomurabacteria bacterium RIFCSPLOWO2_01_FULL_39_17]|uniref:Glutamate--tRNA ligase n=1 Tax=Candidatus Nomurabacteria bacterium RIFCSPLOWO2_01_FULL_39_17 TaxID=1801770 RepID=A0A1F6WVK7_9BACT|nr:MAG: glutamate--tRNA ligase [Candidatus Nomurabacteria bacterium RIFCSPLOWO2_01_FULL_39_17]